MVELVGDGLGAVLQGDEIEDVEVVVETAFDFDGGAVVVAVQPFALVALVADEVPRAEDQVVLGDADFVVFSHDREPGRPANWSRVML